MYGGLEPRAYLHAEQARRWLHQESAVERERARARPIHVRIDAVAVIPPPHVLAGKLDRRCARAEAAGERRGDIPRHRELTEPDVVALVDVVQDRSELLDGIGLERALAVRAQRAEPLVRSALADAIGAITI